MGVISVKSVNATPTSFLDKRRPAAMLDADKIYDKLISKIGESSVDTLEFSKRLRGLIKSTKTIEIDKFWNNVEKEFNKGHPIKVKATSDIQKLLTGFSLFYSALNDLDPKAFSSRQLMELREAYYDARHYVEAKYSQSVTGKDKRTLSDIIYSTDERLTAVTKNYNKRIEEGKLQGPTIPLTS